MIQCYIALLIVPFQVVLGQAPEIRIHSGFISVHDAVYGGSSTNAPYIIGHPYTFELFLDHTHTQDYVIEKCTMNGVQFIGPNGCVQCSSNVLQSVETERYNVPGAMKRTLVHFNAPSNSIVFDCTVNIYQCCGCAERSCERRPILLGMVPRRVPVHCGGAALLGMGSYSPPAGGAYAVSSSHDGFWPWWLWLLLALLLLLLILCCIACCLAAFARKRRKETTTVTRVATAAENKGVGIAVGTESLSVHEKGVGTNGSLCNPNHDVERITPAIAVIGAEKREFRSASRSEKDYREERYEEQRSAQGTSRFNEHRTNDVDDRRYEGNEGSGQYGAYSVREAKLSNERIIRAGRPPVPPNPPSGFHDRSSYRNFAYERDMGRVAPMSGFDEVETTERRYCLSDDECDIVEKDIKRTHTTRFAQESRQVECDSDSGSERFREEGVHHAVYAQSLPV